VLRDTAATVAQLVDAGQRVFVHCVAAENRAPSVAAAYLMTRGTSLGGALERVGEALGGVPHQPFLRQGLEQLQSRP
jgi:protein-tyrosine phosphatase